MASFSNIYSEIESFPILYWQYTLLVTDVGDRYENLAKFLMRVFFTAISTATSTATKKRQYNPKIFLLPLAVESKSHSTGT